MSTALDKQARELANDLHCRYCDVRSAKCKQDIESDVESLLAFATQVREQSISLTAIRLADAWAKYERLFGVPPRGTVKQMAAMIEFLPKELAELPAPPETTEKERK